MWAPTKKTRCGPPCERCFNPVIQNGIVRRRRKKNGPIKTFIFHRDCFPCRLCKKSRQGWMEENGFHRSCQPCTGCGKAFKHTTPTTVCTKRCKTRAPVMDIVLVASMRKKATLPKVLMMKIFSFTFVLKPNVRHSLSLHTIAYIKEIEERRKCARHDRSLR